MFVPSPSPSTIGDIIGEPGQWKGPVGLLLVGLALCVGLALLARKRGSE